jgi:hypothetical protein
MLEPEPEYGQCKRTLELAAFNFPDKPLETWRTSIPVHMLSEQIFHQYRCAALSHLTIILF